MSVRRRPLARIATAWVGGALLMVGLVACSDEPAPVADGSSIAAMLRLLPDTANARKEVFVTLYAAADTAAGLDSERGSKEEELRRLVTLAVDGGVAGGPFAANQRADRQYRSLGHHPTDVVAEVTAGENPETLAAAVVATTEGQILDAAAKVKGADRREVKGTSVVRWLDDMAIEPGLETPIGDIPGQAGRLAVPSKGVVAYAHSDRGIEQLVGVSAGDARPLSTNGDLTAVATGLDDADVYSAYLSDQPLRGRRGAPSPRPGPATVSMPSYRALGVGVAGTVERPQLVVVLVAGDDDSAETIREALEARVADGVSATTGRPWANVLRDPEILRRGSTVHARFDVESTMLWLRIVLQEDTLLAAD